MNSEWWYQGIIDLGGCDLVIYYGYGMKGGIFVF